MSFSAMDHHESNRVVDDAEYSEFSVDAIDAVAAQHVHPHRGLEMTQVRLDLPSASIKLGNGLLGIPLGVKQRGDERHLS